MTDIKHNEENSQYCIHLGNHNQRYGQIGKVVDNDGKHALITWLIDVNGKSIEEDNTLAISALITKEVNKATVLKARFGGANYIAVFQAGSVVFPDDIKVKVASLLKDYKAKMTIQSARKVTEAKQCKPKITKESIQLDDTPVEDREKYKGMYVGMIVGAVNGASPRYGWKGVISKLDKSSKKISVLWQVNRAGNRVNEKCTYRANNFGRAVNTDVILTPHTDFTILPYKTNDMSAVCFATQTKDQGKDCGNYLIQYVKELDVDTGVQSSLHLTDVTREEAINKGRELCAAGTTASVFKADLIAEISYVPTVKIVKK